MLFLGRVVDQNIPDPVLNLPRCCFLIKCFHRSLNPAAANIITLSISPHSLIHRAYRFGVFYFDMLGSFVDSCGFPSYLLCRKIGSFSYISTEQPLSSSSFIDARNNSRKGYSVGAIVWHLRIFCFLSRDVQQLNFSEMRIGQQKFGYCAASFVWVAFIVLTGFGIIKKQSMMMRKFVSEIKYMLIYLYTTFKVL